jgi:acyl carrier protein
MIKERIFKTISTVLDTPIAEINENSSSDNVTNWDSIGHLNLILALEEEFNISIPDDMVGNLVNYKLIEYIVNEQTK